ncbi:GroES-like protein [Trichoderma citrinoviride]|uniref:GroES-like protein n=1 Tax=Trichoderma citrinoviride TaxID=58853 RepID=A0A2T4B1K6_9HYPO|nr:GroES-like protein [Trichoderma citrinoviride]PTB63194.1 GroES-like protein [Trichoderma citrinoviride]
MTVITSSKTMMTIAEASTLTSFATATLKPVPYSQRQLLLHDPRQPYKLHTDKEIPELRFGDLLVEVYGIGLNQIDWNTTDLGLVLPSLPCVNGREFIGRIIASNVDRKCRLQPGEWVLAVSTDHRDLRKAAFQEYAIVSCYNAMRIPKHVEPFQVASMGVAYVAAGIALGVCLGVTFTKGPKKREFNLLENARMYPEDVPDDLADEVFDAMAPCYQAQPGEWLLVYGASTITGQIAIQLAKLGGLKVVGVADLNKHKPLLQLLATDVLVDGSDLDQAKRDIKRLIPGSLRFAIDAVGPETAEWCQQSPTNPPPVDPVTRGGGSKLSHLVALRGKPETINPNIQVHTVPIRLFHTSQYVGGHLSKWLYELLDTNKLQPPEVEFVPGGLAAINGALERLKQGKASGKRLVIRVKELDVKIGQLSQME